MKDKVIVSIFIILIYGFSLSFILTKEKSISNYERRKLMSNLELKEDFTSNLDTYMNDQFPLRDDLISLSEMYERYILGIKDSKNAFLVNGYIIEKNYPLKEKNVNAFIEKINYINKKYLQNSNVYYAIIPDKSYFLNNNYLKIDFNYLMNKVNREIGINYIDIMSSLKLEDYYKTDIHIKQTSYENIIKKLSNHLNFKYKDYKYIKNTYNNFYGSSYSKVPKFIKPDKLEWLTHEYIKSVEVKHFEYASNKVYEEQELEGIDPYNIFLKGPSSLIEIENKSNQSDKELIIFRDSFASSLVPLLIPYYKKITLIDLRYMKMDIVNNYVDFDNKEVLFLYSTLIMNSNLLKVDIT